MSNPPFAPTPGAEQAAGKIVVLTAPSGSGKTTIARALLDTVPAMRFSVSATTRPPRPHERDGIDYHFVSVDDFRRLIDEGELLEYEEVYPGRFYGTLRSEVERASRTGPILLDIDVHGALHVKEIFGPRALTVFIRPPALDVLEQRLRDRGTETEESLRVRLETARRELSYADRFDVSVVNDELDEAVTETLRRVRQFLDG